MINNYLEKPVLEVKQPFGDFFVVSMPASKLVAVSHSIPAKYSQGHLDGVQRAINTNRIKSISDYCKTESPLFPNTVILAANILNDGADVDFESRWCVKDGVLVIPEGIEAASIVDGQHRIEGIKKALADGADDFDMVCAVYMDLPASQQAEVFATINFNQQKVDKSLAYQLFGYDLDSTEPQYWSPDTLAVNLTRILGKQVSSPFKNHIGYGIKDTRLFVGEGETYDEVKLSFESDPWKVSTSTMVSGITKLISSNPIRDRYDLHKKRVFKKDRSILEHSGKSRVVPPLRALYLDFRDKRIYAIVEDYFSAVRDVLWKNGPEVLKKTVGIQALFDLLDHILKKEEPDRIDLCDRKYFSKLLSRIDLTVIESIHTNYSGSGRTALKKALIEQVD